MPRSKSPFATASASEIPEQSFDAFLASETGVDGTERNFHVAKEKG